MQNKKFFKKGFTLVETLVCLILVSMLLTMAVSSMMKVGGIADESITQINSRKAYNEFIWGLSNNVDSLLSTYDLSYSDFTTDGIVINNVLNEEEIKNSDFSNPVDYETDDFTMYIKGDTIKMDVKIEIDKLNDNITYGENCYITMKGSVVDESLSTEDNIVWKNFAEYTPLNARTKFLKKGEETKTKFIITVLDGKLVEIKSVVCLKKSESNNEVVVNTYTCTQEVSVNVPTFEEEAT